MLIFHIQLNSDDGILEEGNMNIGFIGLGNMGFGMATNILKAGYSLKVFDIHKEALKPLLDAGASGSDTIKDLAIKSDIILSSLPGPKEVEEVALGKDGIIKGINSGAVYIDTSSSSPTLIRRIYENFKEVT